MRLVGTNVHHVVWHEGIPHWIVYHRRLRMKTNENVWDGKWYRSTDWIVPTEPRMCMTMRMVEQAGVVLHLHLKRSLTTWSTRRVAFQSSPCCWNAESNANSERRPECTRPRHVPIVFFLLSLRWSVRCIYSYPARLYTYTSSDPHFLRLSPSLSFSSCSNTEVVDTGCSTRSSTSSP